MSESPTRVWVKSSALDKAVNGKVKSSADNNDEQQSNNPINNDSAENIKWVRGTLVTDDDEEENGETSSSSPTLHVFVEDEQSDRDRAKVDLPADSFKSGNILLADAASQLEQALVKELRSELDKSKETAAKELQKSKDVMEEKEALTKELDAVRSQVGSLTEKLNDAIALSKSNKDELERKEQEIEQLKKEEEQNDASKSDELSAELETLKEENEKLHSEISALKENSGENNDDTLLRQELEKTKAELEAAKKSASDSGDAGDDHLAIENDLLKKENEELLKQLVNGDSKANEAALEDLERAKMEIEDLKNQLAVAEDRAAVEAKRAENAIKAGSMESSGYDMKTLSNLDNEGAIEEILTLQDEVNRLNRELFEARQSQAAGEADSLTSRYNELKRLAEAGIEKDTEIEKLKKEVANLTDQVSSNGHHNGGDFGSDDESGSWSQGSGNRYKFRDEEIEELKNVNEMLRQQVELTKRELGDAQTKLRKEAERSAMELEAFAETLKGVDELRQAAESMSRELKVMKQKEMSEKKRYAEINANDDVSGTEVMEGALKKLGAAPGEKQQPHIWGKVRSAMMGLEGPANRRPSGSHQDDSAVGPTTKGRRRRRRRRNSGDKSVMSAIF